MKRHLSIFAGIALSSILAACAGDWESHLSDGQTERNATRPNSSPEWVSNDGITASSLAVLINERDPKSVEIAAYYQKKRNIPARNIIRLRFQPNRDAMTEEAFAELKRQVDARVPSTIQAYAITWTRPYRVNCMSITSAFALGYKPAYCRRAFSQGCGGTLASPYFGSDAKKPFTQLRIRPAMMLAGESVDSVKVLIDRGVTADKSFPMGSAYLVHTTDWRRSIRYRQFERLARNWTSRSGVHIRYTDNSGRQGRNFVSGKKDMLFYFTGLTRVPNLHTNTFLPGAVADHVTSSGGKVPASSQMSAVRFLEEGATASYGTVVEPCAYEEKFPNVEQLMHWYYKGETVLEAYWKSVKMPGEGLFIGEPLARPYGTGIRRHSSNQLIIDTTELSPHRTYVLEASDVSNGGFRSTGISVRVSERKKLRLRVTGTPRRYYRFR